MIVHKNHFNENIKKKITKYDNLIIEKLHIIHCFIKNKKIS